MEAKIILSLLVSLELVFSIGLIQDTPTKFEAHPGDTIIYGVRIINPYSMESYINTYDYGKEVIFTIKKIRDTEISNVINAKESYHLYAGEKQLLFLEIKIPKENYRDSYSVMYQFLEGKEDDKEVMIDSAISPMLTISILVKEKNEILNIIPQTHTINEINEANLPQPISSTIPIITNPSKDEKVASTKQTLKEKRIEQTKKEGSLIAGLLNKDDINTNLIGDKNEENIEIAIILLGLISGIGIIWKIASELKGKKKQVQKGKTNIEIFND